MKPNNRLKIIEVKTSDLYKQLCNERLNDCEQFQWLSTHSNDREIALAKRFNNLQHCCEFLKDHVIRNNYKVKFLKNYKNIVTVECTRKNTHITVDFSLKMYYTKVHRTSFF
jgi:hypothetical protein